MRIPLAAVLALSLASSAVQAQQQQPDLSTLQKAVTILQQDRNSAMDAKVNSDIRAATLAEENAKLKAEIEELKKKLPADEPQK